MTEEQLKQEIYNVLNTHNPTTCTDKPCKAVTAIMSLFNRQLELARQEVSDQERSMRLCGKLYTKSELELAKMEGIKLGWEESAEGYNYEYTSLCYPGGKRYTDDEILAIVIKDALKNEQL